MTIDELKKEAEKLGYGIIKKTDEFVEFKISITEEIYPITIVKDRYGGLASGGIYTAWALELENVPEEIDGGDNTVFDFWDDDIRQYVGLGDSPNEAVADLYFKINPLRLEDPCLFDRKLCEAIKRRLAYLEGKGN